MSDYIDPSSVVYCTGTTAESDRRMGELMLYLADVCSSDEHWGATKLNKLLRLIDRMGFAEFGEPITGTEYTRQMHGPVPRRLLPVKRMLLETGAAIEKPRSFFGKQQKQLVALREANLSLFTARQIALVDRIVRREWGKSAKQMSDETHGLAWKIAGQNGTRIPYEAVYISDEPITEFDVERTKAVAEVAGF